ncbi:Uma2 family endonuclease [Streptomyces niger]|uniref:Uma2 family endonuclease n=1 Tax=Streptomyces niger TaxID=66373 RepID=UPI000699CB64|nr:Uma2 family endonuclease [Streptomyces niger]
MTWSEWWSPRPVPPSGGFTSDDLDRLADLPRRTELFDGDLVALDPQTVWHSRMLSLLEHALVGQVPDEFEVFREFDVKLDERNRVAPDVLVATAGADTGPKDTWLRPEDVLLAVEAVSVDSAERDRDVKPRKYAAVGIPHFWRAERRGGQPFVHVYELDPATRNYGLIGIQRDHLELAAPFSVDIDVTAIDSRRGERSAVDGPGCAAEN